MKDYKQLIPVNILTGFLGSGKTTLLKKIINLKSMSKTIVLVNEFGEVGLDHHLLERVDENLVVLQSGCICCTIREDLTSTLRDLWDKRSINNLIYNRVIVETTGLADPAPIIYSLSSSEILFNHYRLGNIITTVDVLNGLVQLKKYPETIKQIAVADRIIVTKTDINKGNLSDILNYIVSINPSSSVLYNKKRLAASLLFSKDTYDPKSKSEEVFKWINQEAFREKKYHKHDKNRHGNAIKSFCISFDKPIDWNIFGIWVTMLIQAHGENILRLKAILNIIDVKEPVAIHGVQHIIHPPIHLDAWPSTSRESKLVFIVKDLDPDKIKNSLAKFNLLGKYLS